MTTLFDLSVGIQPAVDLFQLRSVNPDLLCRLVHALFLPLCSLSIAAPHVGAVPECRIGILGHRGRILVLAVHHTDHAAVIDILVYQLRIITALEGVHRRHVSECPIIVTVPVTVNKQENDQPDYDSGSEDPDDDVQKDQDLGLFGLLRRSTDIFRHLILL